MVFDHFQICKISRSSRYHRDLQKLCSPPRKLRVGNKRPALFLKKPLCMNNLLPACKIFIESPVVIIEFWEVHFGLCLSENSYFMISLSIILYLITLLYASFSWGKRLWLSMMESICFDTRGLEEFSKLCIVDLASIICYCFDNSLFLSANSSWNKSDELIFSWLNFCFAIILQHLLFLLIQFVDVTFITSSFCMKHFSQHS